jgi:hypothetical protein
MVKYNVKYDLLLYFLTATFCTLLVVYTKKKIVQLCSVSVIILANFDRATRSRIGRIEQQLLSGLAQVLEVYNHLTSLH